MVAMVGTLSQPLIMLNEHERLLIEHFVKKDKQERLRFLMSEPSRRGRLRTKSGSATF